MRRVVIRVLAILGLLLFGLVSGVVVLNAVGVLPSGSEGSPNDPPPSLEALIGAANPAEWVHVAATAGLLALGVLSLLHLIVRTDGIAAREVLAVFVAWLVTVPLVGDPNNIGGQAGAVDPIFLAVALPPAAAALLARPWQSRARTADRRLLLLAAIAAVPAGWFAVDQALMQRNTFPPTADPHHNAHWWFMAIWALAVALMTATKGLSQGSRLTVIVAGLSALAFALASIVSTTSASAVGLPWAIATAVWSLVVLATSFSRQRGPTDADSTPSVSP